ncbi:tRNA G46 methylase TrmB [Pseudomonas lini]|nr:tRNA G46 methylase TrmB [Pseudomonas lini]
MAKLEPDWRFTAVDPSEPMLEAAKQQLEANNLLERTAKNFCMTPDLETLLVSSAACSGVPG